MIKPQKKINKSLLSSFRDPSGFIFSQDSIIYRQINRSYQNDYDYLIASGLYDKLTELGYLVSHQETNIFPLPPEAYKIIQPQVIPFISYPYEWCFSMLKNSALQVLAIQKIALEYNMSLKDASAFNIQFLKGKPTLIDTLSFEKYQEGKPWIAYRQFIEHFLTPLTLMSMTDVRLNRLSTIFLDGIPVDLTAKLLPFRAKFQPSLLFHIFAHSSSQKKYSKTAVGSKTKQGFSKIAFFGLLDNLKNTIKNLKWEFDYTQWSNYYDETNNNYHQKSLKQKAEFVEKQLKFIKPKTVWDLGANTGFFSKIAANQKANVISFDNDYGALEKNYLENTKSQLPNILPLFVDLTNPTPALGWSNQERSSLLQRRPADAVLALALIHHLAISNNLPLEYIASLFSQISKFLIIEFVPKTDSQVKILLSNREDIFPNYTKEGFEKAFSKFYQIEKTAFLKESERILYFMKSKK